MKINELIKQLKEIEKKYGDVGVDIGDDFGTDCIKSVGVQSGDYYEGDFICVIK